jgi:hypothetical protein
MLKKELVVKTVLECLPRGEFRQYKKDKPRPKYKATNKRAPHV